jgi:uncharacterized membrane protein
MTISFLATMAVVLAAAFFFAFFLGKKTAQKADAEIRAKEIEREVRAKNEIEKNIRDMPVSDVDKRLHEWTRD